MIERGCRIRHACEGWYNEVTPREKNIKEIMCYFCLHQLLLLKTLMVRSMMELLTQKYCVRDP